MCKATLEHSFHEIYAVIERPSLHVLSRQDVFWCYRGRAYASFRRCWNGRISQDVGTNTSEGHFTKDIKIVLGLMRIEIFSIKSFIRAVYAHDVTEHRNRWHVYNGLHKLWDPPPWQEKSFLLDHFEMWVSSCSAQRAKTDGKGVKAHSYNAN